MSVRGQSHSIAAERRSRHAVSRPAERIRITLETEKGERNGRVERLKDRKQLDGLSKRFRGFAGSADPPKVSWYSSRSSNLELRDRGTRKTRSKGGERVCPDHAMFVGPRVEVDNAVLVSGQPSPGDFHVVAASIKGQATKSHVCQGDRHSLTESRLAGLGAFGPNAPRPTGPCRDFGTVGTVAMCAVEPG